jgi:hypothetical protein
LLLPANLTLDETTNKLKIGKALLLVYTAFYNIENMSEITHPTIKGKP